MSYRIAFAVFAFFALGCGGQGASSEVLLDITPREFLTNAVLVPTP